MDIPFPKANPQICFLLFLPHIEPAKRLDMALLADLLEAGLANRAGVTPSSAYSMLAPRRKEATVNLVKKLCDGLDITLGGFFSTQQFDALEPEIASRLFSVAKQRPAAAGSLPTQTGPAAGRNPAAGPVI